MTGFRHVAALGSSFAAGPGIPPVEDRRAGRSRANYAHLLAERLGARLTDLTVSGATTQTLLDEPQRVRRRTFAPQVAHLPADADLVTVTAGGNDLGYIGQAVEACWKGWRQGLPVVGGGAGPTVPRTTPAERERAADGLAAVVEEVRRRAPGARVVLVDYLTLVGPDTRRGPGVPIGADVIDGVRAVGEQLAAAYRAASGRTGADLVRVSELSLGHALGSAEPWVAGFHVRFPPQTNALHPNAAGMRAVADAVHRHLAG